MKHFKKYCIVYCNFFVYLVLKFYVPKLFPDLLHLSDVQASDYFGLILNSTASIFGILIAVILLTFELKHISLRRKDDNILSKNVVIHLISLALVILILSLVSYVSIKDLKDANNLTIGYFLGYLFIGFIVSIFPATKNILESTNTLKKTKEEIESLSVEQLSQIETIESNKFIFKDNTLVLVRIRQELLVSVRDSDYEAYASILDSLNKRCIILLQQGKDRQVAEVVFRGFTFILNAGVYEALRVSNHQYYETVWESIDVMYEYAAKTKIYLLHYQYLDFFVMDYIKFLSRNKLGDALSTGAKTLTNALEQNLKHNCPPQERLSNLYSIFEKGKKVDQFIDSSIQWDEINEFVWNINTIQNSSIENGDRQLYDVCRYEFEFLAREIGRGSFSNLGEYQEAYIVIRIISHQTYNALIAHQQKLLDQSMKSFNIDTQLIPDLIKNEKFYVQRVLEEISDYIIKSQRQKVLDDFFSLNYWGAIGRHIADLYVSNKTAKQSIWFIVDTLEKLKIEIENNQLPSDARNYNETKNQLKFLKEYLSKNHVSKNDVVIVKVNHLISSFQEVKEESDTRIVKWNKI